MPSELIELSGHIIDSWTLPRSWDIIMDRGGNFVVEEMRVGRRKDEPSYARLRVEAPNDEVLDLILSELQQFGAVLLHGEDAQTVAVEQDGVLPAKFYSTTNLPTQVRLRGQWVTVEGIEMDVAVVVDPARGRAYSKPMHEVQVGELVVVGHDGIRVQPFERAREREAFAFMQSDVSSEKVKVLAIHEIARQMKETRARNGKILFVLGPAVIHTGAGRYVAELIRRDYVQVIFGGNAIVTHDVEAALFGTSLGVDLRSGEQVEGGHRNHLRAINAIRAVGSLEKALETGLLREGHLRSHEAQYSHGTGRFYSRRRPHARRHQRYARGAAKDAQRSERGRDGADDRLNVARHRHGEPASLDRTHRGGRH